MKNEDFIKDTVKLFLENEIVFCHPHGVKNNAIMNMYILAKDIEKAKNLLTNINYKVVQTESKNFLISILDVE